MPHEQDLKRLWAGYQTGDGFQTGFYGLGLGFDLVNCWSSFTVPLKLLVGQARARGYLQPNNSRLGIP